VRLSIYLKEVSLKKGELNALRNQIKKAIKYKDYPRVALLLERYKSNGGRI
tara:strand:+ start:410 stop:562 length:153 start_codon:yes stop_codon:yes gene_type:complete